MRHTAGSLIFKIVVLAWILLCVHVARSLPATAGERIGTEGARALGRAFELFRVGGR
jgi:hypothetical protein